MFRALLALLLACLLTAGAEHHVTDALSDAVASADDCCPDRVVEPEGDGDCCDIDLGLCCATGSAGVISVAAVGLPERASVDIDAWVPPPAALQTRATGPPPTPPPIG